MKCILTLEDLECGQEVARHPNTPCIHQVLINYKLSPLATAPRWYKQVQHAFNLYPHAMVLTIVLFLTTPGAGVEETPGGGGYRLGCG